MFVRHRFKLAEETTDLLRVMTPKFGFNGFGEFIFYRTYSREICHKCRSGIKYGLVDEQGHRVDKAQDYCPVHGFDFEYGQETWADVIIRMVNGVFSIRKDWYLRNHISWDESFWQHYAKHFAISAFLMEWMPPGRGLWAMGTDYVYARGSMALQNCGFTLIGDHIGVDINWTMDALMNGVGVGFGPVRDDRLKVYVPRGEYDYVIPDSREGWCEATELLINSFIYPGQQKPRLIYDKIRPVGQPIRGFGGISSGPESLMRLHKQIEEFVDMFGTTKWYDSVLFKTDLANAVGCCVISGNVRRSAELCAGAIDDVIDLKNYDKYPYRETHGYMSNNSVLLKESEDFERLDEIAERILTNGEPGIINCRNLPLGRIGKSMEGLRLDKAIGFNPCLTFESKILTADGRGYVAIGELAAVGDDVDVYCIDDRDSLCIARLRHPRKTGEQVPIVKIKFDDGSTLRCTTNHRIMLRDRSFKEAGELVSGDSVAIVNRYDSIPTEGQSSTFWKDYIQLGYGGQTRFEHRMIAERCFGELQHNQHVHHINGNKKDNRSDNLQLVSATAHLSEHGAGDSNPNNSGVSNQELLQMGIALCEQLGHRFSRHDWAKVGISLDSAYRLAEFGSFMEFAIICADLAGVVNDPIDTRTLRLLIKAREQGYDCEVIGDHVHINRVCEQCKQTFWIDYGRREQSFCSFTCTNAGRDYSLNAIGLRKAFAEKRKTIAQEQLRVYVDLKKQLGRMPLRKEWQASCRDEAISPEIGRRSSPFTSWGALVIASHGFNHAVVSVSDDGFADVYNGTVDDFHNYIVKICDDRSKGSCIERGVITPQCGEQPLENKELCTLVESCPTMCIDEQGWYKALEYATLYASTVTLLPTHRPETNAVMQRNRRIGVGIIDVAGWQQWIGTTSLTKNLRHGYGVVRRTNQWVNNEAGIPEAIRVTTIKPGGTTPKLPGLRSGWSWPTFGLTLRRVRVARNQTIHAILAAAGIPHEPDVFSANTDVFEWPIDQSDGDRVRSATEVSLWEQAMMLVLMQREWSDNAVSNTLYFKPKWNLIKDINLGQSFAETDMPTEVLTQIYGILTIGWDEFLEVQEHEENGLRCVLSQDIYSDDWHLKVYRYDPNHEENSVEHVLAAIAPLIKSASVLPHCVVGVYRQMPEEGITREEYNRRLSTMKPIDWSKLRRSDGVDEKYCEGPSCELRRN